MCMRRCGRDHFGNCAEEAKFFVCAGKHEGSEYECTAESCGKRCEPREHYAAKCANCRGPHQATSKGCLKRRSIRQNRAREQTEIRSSPPGMETDMEQDDPPDIEDQAGMEMIQPGPERTVPAGASIASPESGPSRILRRNKSLPRLTREIRSPTESFTGATQLISSSNPTNMSIDDDSALT
jgi:hypothetical protein